MINEPIAQIIERNRFNACIHVLSYVVHIMITYNLLPNNKLEENKSSNIIQYIFTKPSKINIQLRSWNKF